MAITSQSANSLKEVLFNLQMQLKNRGESSGKRLLRTFLDSDQDQSGYLDRSEFESLLNKSGIFLSRQDVNYLMWHFDKNHDGKLSYQEVYETLVPPLTPRRSSIVEFVFSRLSSSGALTLSSLFRSYRARNHPSVASGLKTEEEIISKFLDVFDGNSLNPDTVVTRDKFFKAHREISAAYPIDDNSFIRMMECVWDVKEQVTNAQQDLANLEIQIKEKVRLRMPSIETEENALKKIFKFVDSDHSGYVSLSEFDTGLRRLGLSLTGPQLHSLFEKYDKDSNGHLDYSEFARAVGGNNSHLFTKSTTHAFFS
jgi:Ca2+-binding EF-hand superfamily protein